MTATGIIKGSSKSAAPGQYLGYGLQDVRLCHHLLKSAEACSVSLEFIEDTAIHHPDGSLVLEQAKSALSGNPIGDGSVELWKSFAYWGSLCSEGRIDPASTEFRIYFCGQKKGQLAQLLHAATTDVEAAALLEKIGKKVKPHNQEKGANPKITEFLGAGPDICKQIVLNFRLITDADPLEPIRERLRFVVLDESVDDFCAHAIGTAKNQIAALIREGEVPTIVAGVFRKQLQAFIRKHGVLGYLVPTTDDPDKAKIASVLEAMPVFVQQLLKVQMPDEFVVRAVSDFLRSDADRTDWAAEGRIVKESLDELHNDLEAHFAIKRNEIEETLSSKDEEARGRQLYRSCVTHQAPLEGRSVPGYFIPGTYNMLADVSRIGWHPLYPKFFPAN